MEKLLLLLNNFGCLSMTAYHLVWKLALQKLDEKKKKHE